MESLPTITIEEPKPEIKIWETKPGEKLDATEIERRNKVEAVIAALPSSTAEDLRKHLSARKVRPDNSPDDKYLKGRLFEIFIDTENSTFPGSLFEQNSPENQVIANNLIAFLQDPTRFGVNEDAQRNPDLLQVIFDKEKATLHIVKTEEMKTHFDGRSVIQLGEKGFSQSLRNLADIVNTNAELLRRLGIPEGSQITVGSELKQSLIVPKDMNIEAMNGSNNMFYNKLKRMREAGLLKRSCIKNHEVDLLLQQLLKQ